MSTLAQLCKGCGRRGIPWSADHEAFKCSCGTVADVDRVAKAAGASWGYADFPTCVRDNSDKGDPVGFCMDLLTAASIAAELDTKQKVAKITKGEGSVRKLYGFLDENLSAGNVTKRDPSVGSVPTSEAGLVETVAKRVEASEWPRVSEVRALMEYRASELRKYARDPMSPEQALVAVRSQRLYEYRAPSPDNPELHEVLRAAVDDTTDAGRDAVAKLELCELEKRAADQSYQALAKREQVTKGRAADPLGSEALKLGYQRCADATAQLRKALQRVGKVAV